jgi:hypothetical protein
VLSDAIAQLQQDTGLSLVKLWLGGCWVGRAAEVDDHWLLQLSILPIVAEFDCPEELGHVLDLLD